MSTTSLIKLNRKGGPVWAVQYYVGGKQVRHTSKSKAKATAIYRKISKERRAMAGAALSLAESKEYSEAKSIAGGADLRSVARAWAARSKPEGVKVSDLIKAYCARPTAETTRSSRRIMFERLEAEFGDLDASQVTSAAVRAMLSNALSSPVTINNHIRTYKALFSWATGEGAGELLESNPLEKTEYLKVPRGCVDYYSAEEVRDLFRRAEQSHPEHIPRLVLTYFAGIRPSQIDLMTDDHIKRDFRKISVPAGKEAAYVIDCLPENAWAWLDAYTGPLHPAGWTSARRRLLSPMRRIHSSGRHTAGSQFYAKSQSLDATAKLLGHASTATTRRHYASALAEQADAAEFWSITPGLG